MSSKKPFDHIEEKIKQAAENSLPAFDEKAWQAMEAKLDKENKKRRPLLWWFILPLVLAGGAIGYYNFRSNEAVKENTVIAGSTENTNNKQLSASTETKSATEGEAADPQKNQVPPAAPETVRQTASEVVTNLSSKTENTITVPGPADKKLLSKNHPVGGKKKGRVKTNIAGADPETLQEEKLSQKQQSEGSDAPVPAVAEKAMKEEVNDNAITAAVDPKNELVKPAIKADKEQAVKKEETKKEKPVEAKKDKKQQPVNGFYLLALAGPDAGSTKLLSFSNSNITPKYGLGIGYQFNKRWSVQTGFYVANKKYGAGPADYTIKPGSPMGQYPLEKIKASSLVYEIPLSVRYNLVNSPSLILYGTIGASSYIMKKEKYDCFYRYYNNTYEHEWNYSGNRHLFSTASLSIGIEKPLTSKFSLLAEPSLGIPLSGVGDGKMKMYSAAALFGIKYYPFKK